LTVAVVLFVIVTVTSAVYSPGKSESGPLATWTVAGTVPLGQPTVVVVVGGGGAGVVGGAATEEPVCDGADVTAEPAGAPELAEPNPPELPVAELPECPDGAAPELPEFPELDDASDRSLSRAGGGGRVAFEMSTRSLSPTLALEPVTLSMT
jgi:hypothetical protein